MSVAISLRSVGASYQGKPVLHSVDLDVPRHEIQAIIGPARSGKSTLLTILNRSIDHTPGAAWGGDVRIEGESIRALEPAALRRRIAMVLPLPVGLPMSIRDNVTLAPRMAGLRDRTQLDELMHDCLVRAALWDEVKDRLDELGTKLSGGQQQRLTLARALSTRPDVLCLDEFSIAIDPVTTARIEEALVELKQRLTIVLVTNLIAQARRIADRTAFLLGGYLVEEAPTQKLFADPGDPRTRGYLEGRFG